MTTTTAPIRNGVDTAQVYGTLDAVKAAARARALRVPRHATAGSTARTAARPSRASGAPGRRTPRARSRSSSTPASRPSCSAHNEAPNPAEYLLHALAGCLTLTIVNVAAARKVDAHRGQLDARAACSTPAARPGIDDAYRNGFERIRVTFSIKGDAPREKLEEIVERAKARSVVYDIVTNGVRVDVTAEVG